MTDFTAYIMITIFFPTNGLLNYTRELAVPVKHKSWNKIAWISWFGRQDTTFGKLHICQRLAAQPGCLLQCFNKMNLLLKGLWACQDMSRYVMLLFITVCVSSSWCLSSFILCVAESQSRGNYIMKDKKKSYQLHPATKISLIWKPRSHLLQPMETGLLKQYSSGLTLHDLDSMNGLLSWNAGRGR